MRRSSTASVFIVLLSTTVIASAATSTVRLTPRRFGPLVLEETTLREAKEVLGHPSDVVRLGPGCWDKMKRLRWGPDLNIIFVLSDGRHRVHEPTITDTHVDVANGDRWKVETGRGLSIGDSKRRMLDLYPNAKNYRSRTYTLLVRDGYRYQTATIDDKDRVIRLTAAISC